MTESNSGAMWGQHDPFEEDFFLMPYEEELLARAKQVFQDNQDALRLHIELLACGILESNSPELIKIFVTVVWHWKDIDPKWVAEACHMSVRDVCALVESQEPPLWLFPCLDCGRELRARDRRRQIRRQHNLEAFSEGESDDYRDDDLFCKSCLKQRDEYDNAQRLLDRRRQEAIHDERRQVPYTERLQSEEWVIIKRQVHRRDGYRCRLCNRGDRPLHVHHRTYSTYDEERLEDLITLCNVCHRNFHSLSKVS
ncbi:MAG: hypothetical protein M3246_00470 [Actinomycetota bacterium]|nr:hypothetical protein [Actinomycetota bacterium]